MSLGSPFGHVHTCGACGCPSSRHERDEDRECRDCPCTAYGYPPAVRTAHVPTEQRESATTAGGVDGGRTSTPDAPGPSDPVVLVARWGGLLTYPWVADLPCCGMPCAWKQTELPVTLRCPNCDARYRVELPYKSAPAPRHPGGPAVSDAVQDFIASGRGHAQKYRRFGRRCP